jgi:hypothetical protein
MRASGPVCIVLVLEARAFERRSFLLREFKTRGVKARAFLKKPCVLSLWGKPRTFSE